MDTVLMLLSCFTLHVVAAKSTFGRDYGNATPSSSSATPPEDPPYSVLGFTDRAMYNYVMFGSICGFIFIMVSAALIFTACDQRRKPGSDTVTCD